MMKLFFIFAMLLTLSAPVSVAAGRPVESERIQEYRKRNYTWPIQTYSPNFDGWKAVWESRFAQVAEIPDPDMRYMGYVQTMHASLVVPNFTEHGFGLTRCPEPLLQDLRQAIQDGLSQKYCEGRSSTIEGPYPWAIDRRDLMDRVAKELHGKVEEFAGMELNLAAVYGLRLFRNESAMKMHIDKKGTHAIGFVLHVDRSDDAEPWPLFIEDFHGRTHEVYLTPGDMIIYESSKLLHGRPRTFKGSWYSNVIGHYHPTTPGWSDQNHQLEAHYAVPLHWTNDPPKDRKMERLQIGGGMKEPDCPDGWCRVKEAIKWNGPAEEGYWIDPQNHKHKFPAAAIHGDHSEF